MSHGIPDFMVNYLANRATARAERVRDFLANLTDRERALFHDAAVMGYVRGSLVPRGEEIPLNPEIVAEVVDACFVLPDLYPAVNAGPDTYGRTVEYFVQCQQPDETWEQASSTTTDPAVVVEQLAAQRRARPEFEFRIARRAITTTVDIVVVKQS